MQGPLTDAEQELVLHAHEAEHVAMKRDGLGGMYRNIWFNAATGKAQWVRIADVFVIGPLMVAGGLALQKRGSAGWGLLLIGLGFGTSLYNGINWWITRNALNTSQIVEPAPVSVQPVQEPVVREAIPQQPPIYGGAANVNEGPVSAGGSYHQGQTTWN